MITFIGGLFVSAKTTNFPIEWLSISIKYTVNETKNNKNHLWFL